MNRKKGEILKPLIKMPESPDDCWVWQGKINKPTGYGHKQFDGHTLLAHRWVYSMFNGHIPDDMVIDHLCGNRACVNPRHLEAVSQTENCRRGNGTKLTEDQARQIKLRIPHLKWGGRKKLAQEFNVSENLISDIKYGRAWADLDVGPLSD